MNRIPYFVLACFAIGLPTIGSGQDPAGDGVQPIQIPVLGGYSDAKVTELFSKMKASEKMKTLLRDRLETAKVTVDSRAKEFMNGRGTLDFLLGASQHLLKSELELSDNKTDQLAAYEAHLKILKLIYDTNKERYDAGRIPIQDLKESEYYVLDAEIAIERLKAK